MGQRDGKVCGDRRFSDARISCDENVPRRFSPVREFLTQAMNGFRLSSSPGFCRLQLSCLLTFDEISGLQVGVERWQPTVTPPTDVDDGGVVTEVMTLAAHADRRACSG